MKLFTTISLAVVTALLITASVFLTVDGNLAKLTGWYRVTPGMPLFTNEHTQQFDKICWMRLKDLHEEVECAIDAKGDWWIIRPFKDKLNPAVAKYLLAFAESATIIDTLSMDETARRNLRDFGFSSDFCSVTLKVPSGDDLTTAARFTLGKEAPWLASVGDGKHVVPTTYLQTDFYGDDDRVHVVSGNITPLFANGLRNLRDPMPLRFDPNEAVEIQIQAEEGSRLSLLRNNSESPWYLKTQNTNTLADQETAAKLLMMLCSMEAVRVQSADDVKLTEAPTHTVTIRCSKSNKTQILRLYKPFASNADFSSIGALCYATVNDRNVVFTLRAEPKMRRKGGYSSIVNGIFSMPVLPAEDIAKYRGLNEIYTDELPLTMDSLRSKRLAVFDERDVECVLIRSRNSKYPLRLNLIPGIKESNTQDAWTVEAQGRRAIEAETEIVRNFLRSFRTIPVEAIVEDLPMAPDEQSQAKRSEIIRKYGLFTPDYRIFITPRTCAFRTTIFGTDLPLIKDRDVKIYSISLHQNGETGEFERYAMEEHGDAIFKLSHKHTRNLAMQQNAWKARNLLSFHISELKRFTLGYHQAPLVLDYESVAESWSGTLGGVDITPNINPHRALNCVDRVRKIKVKEWLDSHDEDAIAKLAEPVFSLKIELEVMDHSDAEAIIADAEELGHDQMDESGSYRQDGAEAALDDDSALADMFREQAFNVRPVKNVTYTIELAPVNNHEDSPLFYGQIKETGQMFLMSFEDAQSLASSPLENNVHLMQTK